jgi:ankyrin repeat protein
MSSSAADLQLRRAAAAAAAAAATVLLPTNVDEVVHHSLWSCEHVSPSTTLFAILASTASLDVKLKGATALLLQGEAVLAAGGSSLIDLNFRQHDSGSLLLLLLAALGELVDRRSSSRTTPTEMALLKEAEAAFGAALPHVCKIIRASYDTGIKGANGKDALALLASVAMPLSSDDWAYHLTDALLDRGANVNTRGAGGQTPLMIWSRGVTGPEDPDSVVGPLMLLQRGADIDARSNDGTTCAHAIARSGNAALAEALADAGWLAAADLTLLSHRGETALQMAQRRLKTEGGANRRTVRNLLIQQPAIWKTQVRPLVHQCLSHSFLIPDLAHMVLSFVDGKERGQQDLG